MKYITSYILLFLFLNAGFVTDLKAQSNGSVTNQEMQPVDYVNPYIGNIKHMLDPTYPEVHLPNSYLRVSPEREDYTDVTLQGLPLISKRGSSLAFRLSPYQGSPEGLQPIISYSYDNEEVTPYSYSVLLNNEETKVNFGVSRQSAMYSLEFQGEGSPFLVLSSQKGELKWDGRSISGYQLLGNNTKVYIYAIPDKAPEYNYVLGEGNNLTNKKQNEGEGASIVLKYPEDTGEVELRYGISFISEEQARKNLEREVASKDIAALHSEARKMWNDALSRVKVQGGTKDDKAVLYTGLYRSYNRPVSISEDGRYFNADDGQVHEDGGTPLYVDDAGWYTFRALHPLNVLIQPEKEEDILSSYLRLAEHLDSFRLPKATGFIGDHAVMHSNHIIVSLLDGYRKGLQVDLSKAFEAGKNVATEKTLAPDSYDSAGQLSQFYWDKGYIPAFWVWQRKKEIYPEVNLSARRQAVSVTLGVAQDEWALAQMAMETGNEEEFKQLCEGSFNYRNLFNPGSQFFHPKDRKGTFISSFDYIGADSWNHKSSYYDGANHYYTEGNGWTYRFGLQHNIADLINMMGGRENFISNLDALFSTPKDNDKEDIWIQYPHRTGNIGQFAMGNEPAFHKPYLYNYAGQPWKTQQRIRMLLHQWFQNDLMGLPGVDEGGAMSAFAVFSYMGFYPVTPGIPVYNIGSPVFDRITINVPGRKDFEIVAKNNSSQNKYIQSATLNGESLNKPWFRHSDITGGGKLVLQMGPRPNKQWGSDPGAAPPSMPLPIDSCQSLR